MRIGYIGLGKMGSAMVARLTERGHTVLSYDKNGSGTAVTLAQLVQSLPTPRTIWIMLPIEAVEETVRELTTLLSPNDTLIDGGNSFYKDSIRRAIDLSFHGIHFIDVGVANGPQGAREGSCLLIGGERADYDLLQPLWIDLAAEHGIRYVGEHGTGHFIKSIHNGIEYGIMETIAEGFATMKAAPFDIDLTAVAETFEHHSIIESNMIHYLIEGFKTHGEDLTDVTSVIPQTGGGAFAVTEASDLHIETPAIASAVRVRSESNDHPSYTNKIINVLRASFGGHSTAPQGQR